MRASSEMGPASKGVNCSQRQGNSHTVCCPLADPLQSNTHALIYVGPEPHPHHTLPGRLILLITHAEISNAAGPP